jgi:hypothetical protein
MIKHTVFDDKDMPSTLIDGDTEVDHRGRRQRHAGTNAREEAGVKEDKYGEEYFSSTEAGAIEQTRAMQQLIEEGNFIYKERTGEYDQYGREIIERYNDRGDKLSEVAIASGIMLPNIYTDTAAIKALDAANLNRALGLEGTDFDSLGRTVQDAMFQYGVGFKDDALDESTYDPALHSGVMFRDHSRTLDNEAKGVWGQIGTAWDQGWVGIKEGFYGYLDAIGETTEIEMLENIGDQGVLRAREEMRLAPEVILDYREVDSIGNAFQYVLNNAAMAAPYMVTTFGAMAAAVPVGVTTTLLTGNPMIGGAAALGTAVLPTSFIYAGQTWNEMEGDRGIGQFITASMAGVTIGALDRLGLKGLIAPSVNIMTKEGMEQAAQALVQKGNGAITLDEARKRVFNATIKEQGRYLQALMRTEGMKDVITKYGKPFSKKDVALHGLQGALRESTTELSQEAVQMAAAGLLSDKDYTTEEMVNRLINAGVAGGTLGGGLSIAGNVYEQGKAQLYQAGLQKMDQKRFSVVNNKRMEVIDLEGRIASVDEKIAEQSAAYQTDADRGEFDPYTANAQKRLSRKKLSTEIVNTISNSPVLRSLISKLSSLDLKSFISMAGKSDLALDAIINPTGITFDEATKRLNEAKAKFEAAKEAFTQASEEINTRFEAGEISAKEASRLEAELPEFREMKDAQKEISRADDIATKSVEDGETKSPEEVAAAQREVARRRTGGKKLTKKEIDALRKYADAEEKAESEIESGEPTGNRFWQAANRFEKTKKGLPNFIKNNKDLFDYISSTTTGIQRLYQALEKALGDINKIMSSPTGRFMLAMFSQYTTGSFHHGRGFRQFNDAKQSELSQYVDEQKIAKLLGYRKATTKNIEEISRRIRVFITSGAARRTKKFLENQNNKASDWNDPEYSLNEARALFFAAESIRTQSELILREINLAHQEETGIPNAFIFDEPGWWYKSRGFDFRKVRNDKDGFIKWAISAGADAEYAKILWQNIAYKGQATFLENFSLVDGNYTYYPGFIENEFRLLQSADGFDQWANENMFEHINLMANDAAKYITVTKYFGHAGRKLDYLIEKMKSEVKNPNSGSKMTLDDVDQFAYYYKAGIDSNYGNFNPITNPKWAAVNRFLVTWSIFAGLSLSAISSMPETAMVYYALMDDDEWKAASNNLVNELGKTFTEAINKEEDDTTKLLNRSGQPITNNTVVDRYATGERDVSMIQLHESFFTVVGIKHITHFQRKAAAATAMDTVRFRSLLLLSAPIKERKALGGNPNIEFDFEKFDAFEGEAYTMLADLGIDVEGLITKMMDMDTLSRDKLFNIDETSYRDVDTHFMPMSPKQVAIIDNIKKKNPTADEKEIIAQAKEIEQFVSDQIETAVYRFVIERVQAPQATNRPLFFQDPRYQLITQFNGFISTFTAVVVPKLWERYLLKGQPQMKYNTFAVIVTMLAIGGGSQYLKDLIKFGLADAETLGASPYINAKENDTQAYIQRAVYASGVLGQGERVVDALFPLYPDRDDWLFSLLVGEAGPTARNVSNIVTGVGQLIGAEDQADATRGVSNIYKTLPFIGPASESRRTAASATTDIFAGKSPVRSIEEYLF